MYASLTILVKKVAFKAAKPKGAPPAYSTSNCI